MNRFFKDLFEDFYEQSGKELPKGLPVQTLANKFTVAIKVANVIKWDWFFIQCFYESAFFTKQKENLYYTSLDRLRQVFRRRIPKNDKKAKLLLRNPEGLADVVYKHLITGESRQKLRGRDLVGEDWLQITGEKNKHDIFKFLGLDIWEKKNRLSLPKNMFIGSACYWVMNGLDESLSFKECTKKITGSSLFAYQDRIKFLKMLYETKKSQ